MDGDGDTLLILKHSNAPFAVSHIRSTWPDHLPRSRSLEFRFGKRVLELAYLPPDYRRLRRVIDHLNSRENNKPTWCHGIVVTVEKIT